MDVDSLTSTASSMASNGASREQKQSKKESSLTIDKPTKIASVLAGSKSYNRRPPPGVVIVKWVSTFILGGLLLAFVTESKVSVIALSENMNKMKNDGSVTEKQHKSELFVMLMLIALVPNVINFFRGIWGGGFRKDIPWPRKRSMVAGLIVSILESTGICLFIFLVPGLSKPVHVILLMNCVFLFPTIIHLIRCLRQQGVQQGVQQGTSWKVLFAVALLLEVAGIGITGYIMKDKDISDIWVAPVAIICLSVSWTPSVQKFLLQTTPTSEPKQNEETLKKLAGETIEETGYRSSSQSASMGYQTGSEVQHDLGHVSIQLSESPFTSLTAPRAANVVTNTERPTWKLTIYMSFLKIIFTFTISLVLFEFYLCETNNFENNMENFKNGWAWSIVEQKEIYYFVANIVSSVLGYLVGYIACTTCMQRWALAVPLVTAGTPLVIVLLLVEESCTALLVDADVCQPQDTVLVIVAGVCLLLAQGMTTGWLLFRSQSIVMQKEGQLFWTPMYNPVLLEQWLMLARRNEHNDDSHEDPIQKAKRSKIIICTTMYREADFEMRQLLESIQGINLAQSQGHRHFESHIFFDGAVKDRNPTEFVLQLITLVESTLDVKAQHCCKTMTPYGMSLSWKLNAAEGTNGMVFKIHLKDNFKVKNKKRWSQVMYMSYVLDFLMTQMDNVTDEETYIMTTDADVRFTPDSVEALLDLMTRDYSVGAVCARTHPLGNGPLVWYQVFEYAIGHWFQKAAEHVIGSVLCSPGCFSVYRCKALKDILPEYATNVEHAFDFLTKDMGEDRWLCTLMVQSGWRIEYCAASENSTHCPEDFDEFYKQRRRWVVSTLANLMLLIKEWHIVAKLNHRVSFVFLIYQAMLLFATLIGPSSVILVVAGGLVYGWDIESVSSVIVQVLVCVGFTLTCLFTSSKTQLNVGKLLTFLYAVVMTAVLVGTAVQIVSDFTPPEPAGPVAENTTTTTTTIRPSAISEDITFSTTTVYLAAMASLFLVTGILHLKEFIFLLHGMWYLLCLPSGYLVLMIYSICNITDRSWGTREVKTRSVVSKNQGWKQTLQTTFRSIFFCCFPDKVEMTSIAIQTDQVKQFGSRSTSVSESHEGALHSAEYENGSPLRSMSEDHRHDSTDRPLSKIIEGDSGVYRDQDDDDEDEDIAGDIVVAVADWLPRDMKHYAKNFVDNGFENTLFISGMTEKELKDIGIKRRGMKRYIMSEIKKLPDYEIQADVPENVEKWLEMVGLPQYKSNFKREQIKTSKDMEVLKSFGRSDIEKELKITKIGHVKRLLYAIRKLRNPTETERKILDVKKSLDKAMIHRLRTVNLGEYEFWDKLKNRCLLPQSTAYGLEDDLKVKLGDLRNSWLMIFAVSNTLWLILIMTLANKGNLLTVFGSNPIGLVVLILFSAVLLIQFFAMIIHRVSTLTHFLGRAPYRFGDTFNTSWAFNDSDMKNAGYGNDDFEARLERDQAQIRAKTRLDEGRGRYRRNKGEKQPLIAPQKPSPLS